MPKVTKSKHKKGSKAYREQVSKAQKASWARRKQAKVEITKPFEHEVAAEPFGDIFSVYQWINAADSPSERQLRKAAMHGALYSGMPMSEGRLLDIAYSIKRQTEEAKAREALMSKEGIETVRWEPKAGSQQSNFTTKDARPLNPDEMFVKSPLDSNPINPLHYQRHPSGVECIVITEHFNFNRGNAIKYIWRADEKGSVLENLRKARWYLDREIQRLEKEATER